MTFPAKTILLVEDEAILALDEAKQLRGLGYGVECAYRGEQAVAMVRERPDAFDLILMDIDLGPGMDGVQAAMGILKERDVPVVFLSSHTEPEVVEKTEKITSYGYVVKDSGLTVLAASIKMAFKLHRAYRELERHEEALRESQERFSNAFEYATVGMALLSPEGRWIKVNRSLCESLGYSEEEILATDYQSITHPEDLESSREYFRRLIAGDVSSYHLQKRYRHKTGRAVWVQLSVSIVRDKKGRPMYAVTQVQDITERKGAEEQLAVRQAALESSISAIGLADLDGKLIYANRAYIKLWGYERAEEILGMPVTAFAESEAQVREVVAALKAGRTYVGEGVSRRTDGTEFVVQLTANLVTSPDGRPVCMMASFLDITARKKTEAALNEMSEVFGLFMEHNPIYVYVKDKDARYVSASRNYEQLTGRPIPEILGKPMDGLFPADFAKTVMADDLRVLRGEGSAAHSTEVLGGRTYSTIKFPIRVDGKPKYLAGYSIDITEQKKAEAELLHFRDLLAYIISHDRSAVAVLDSDLRYIYVSEQFLRDYKVQEKNVIGKLHYEVFPDLSREVREVHRKALAGEVSSKEADPYFRADGSVEWTRWECRPWYKADGTIGGIVLYTEVITDRVRADQALRESEARYRSLFENSHAVMLIIDPDGGAIVDANPAAGRFYGWSREELRRKRIGDINTLTPEEVQVELGRARRAEREIFYFKHRHADGSVGDVAVYSGPIDFGGRQLLFSIVHDVSSRTRAEEALRQAVRQKEVLMMELQHRIKNSLAVVSGLIGLESERVTDERSSRIFAETRSRIRSIASLYERLYGTSEIDAVDLHTHLQALAEELFRTYAPRGIRLETRLDEVRLDTKRAVPLGLILNELVMNALKYAYPAGSPGEVRVGFERTDEGVMLTVADDGVGLPEGFDPAVSGGMGMSLVRMMVDQIDGSLTISGGPGTRVSVRFKL